MNVCRGDLDVSGSLWDSSSRENEELRLLLGGAGSLG